MKKSNSLKDFLTLTHRIMHLALQGLLRVDFLHETSKILMEFSACDSVEMWLRERGKFYRSEVKRATNQPFYFEIMPSGKDKQGRVIPDFKKCTCFEKICQDVFI